MINFTTLCAHRIARECGFGSALSLREHFTREVGDTPAAYRKAFGMRHVADEGLAAAA